MKSFRSTVGQVPPALMLAGLAVLGVYYAGKEVVRETKKAEHGIVHVVKKAGHAVKVAGQEIGGLTVVGVECLYGGKACR